MNPLFCQGVKFGIHIANHYYPHRPQDEGRGLLQIYFGGFRQCLSLWRRFSTPRPITQKQKPVKVFHPSIDQRTIKPDRTVSNYKRTCPAILKSRPTCKVSKTYSWMFLLISRKEINLFNMQLPHHHHHHHINVYFFVIIFIFLLLV